MTLLRSHTSSAASSPGSDSLISRRTALAAALTYLASSPLVHAAVTSKVNASDLTPRHPWLSSQITHHGASAYFTNLQSGNTIRSPFVVKFGLSDWNLAPAKFNFPRTGHHLLLVDAPLPSRPNAPIAHDKRHIHYSAGQMEAVLNLPPGRHTLRLLLANHANVPYFIYSPEIEVHVREGRSELPASVGRARKVELLQLPEDGKVVAPFKLRFHASGLNVSSARSRSPNTGHFVVTFTRNGSSETISFENGATEDWFAPPPGEYQVELKLVKNGKVPESMASMSTTLEVLSD